MTFSSNHAYTCIEIKVFLLHSHCNLLNLQILDRNLKLECKNILCKKKTFQNFSKETENLNPSRREHQFVFAEKRSKNKNKVSENFPDLNDKKTKRN